jgi:hypothetical protein
MENKKRKRKFKPKKFDYEHQYETKWSEGGGVNNWKFEDIVGEEQKTMMYALANGYKIDKSSLRR